MDRYGHTQDHQNFQLEMEDNYVSTLPTEMRATALAMQYAEAWHMQWNEVLDMPYAEFYEAMMVAKAIHYKRPWWTGAAGENAYTYERAFNKKLNKPRRTT